MASTTPDNTDRFTGRAAAYTKFRDAYPPAIISFVTKTLALPPYAIIADLGSGTGKLSHQLLQHYYPQESDAQPFINPSTNAGVTIIGVEPNAEMRAAQDEGMKAWTERGVFRSVDGTAETSSLHDSSVDAIIAGAAFHWFDGPKTREEILRIGKRDEKHVGCPVALVTRMRATEASADEGASMGREVQKAFEQMTEEMGINYTYEEHRAKFSDEALRAFFGNGEYKSQQFPTTRQMSWQMLKGVMGSYSVIPREGTTEYDGVLAKVRGLFEKFEKDGMLEVTRDGLVYYGFVS